jgi:branched-chain amino acid aminotransferase/4-amino-4-deoxychorismate lyase
MEAEDRLGAGAPSDDRGLLLGDGLFETVLFRAGRPVLWDAHLDRLTRGCDVLGLPAPDPEGVARAAAAALTRADLAQARAAVRVTWTAGSGGRGLARPQAVLPRLIVSAAASARPTTPATLVTSAVRRNPGSPSARLKSLSYLDNVMARREAALKGADEALMLNADGHLACASAANLFWIVEGRLFTPALECGVLDGIIRGETIAAARRLGAPVREVAAGPGALDGAEALFLTSSLIGLRPVSRLDGRTFGEPHALVRTLKSALEAVI